MQLTDYRQAAVKRVLAWGNSPFGRGGLSLYLQVLWPLSG